VVLRITAGSRTCRTTVTAPVSVTWTAQRSLLGQVSSLSSRSDVTATVDLGAVVPNTSVALVFRAQSIRLR